MLAKIKNNMNHEQLQEFSLIDKQDFYSELEKMLLSTNEINPKTLSSKVRMELGNVYKILDVILDKEDFERLYVNKKHGYVVKDYFKLNSFRYLPEELQNFETIYLEKKKE